MLGKLPPTVTGPPLSVTVAINVLLIMNDSVVLDNDAQHRYSLMKFELKMMINHKVSLQSICNIFSIIL
ncbi:MAG: hypothetical protein B7X98_02215 [Methylophilaceae bacterium 17-43-7]|nr:MAG: hypothetical protein B7X98_02215 [Methylophilaceae bacterium 17-43-7]